MCRPCLTAHRHERFAALPLEEQARRKAREKEYWRNYNQTHKESKNAHTKRYRDRHPERVEACRAAWRKAHPETVKIRKRSAHARKRAKQVPIRVSTNEIVAWLKRQRMVCHWCGTRCVKDFQIDHRVPLARGGLHEVNNLVIACRPCNQSKSHRDPIEFAQSIGKLL
jgi:5-methylcytosine-specific restriction endonuclease McrA